MPVSVHIATSDPSLRRALTARLERTPGLTLSSSDGTEGLQQPSDIVISPASDCSPERCAELAVNGVTVIVLAAIPRESERQRYASAAAAAYVPMAVDSQQLLSAIWQAVDGDQRAVRGNGHRANALRIWDIT